MWCFRNYNICFWTYSLELKQKFFKETEVIQGKHFKSYNI